ncbi:unnamed protein product [Gongylonema pulchrum]|uniref:ThiF domain-containing protein n=1 Tax=Gongylonema pulchrum TaxID=637853 RepID=A0A183ELF7_9BILA|nr:unnamed protein product [Gongylonema pulchrum]
MTGSVDEQVGASQASSTITEDEKEVYDRQIRLWGLEAQNRLRNSTVLIAGLSGCGGEVAKNLVLAGLKSLTLLDSHNVSETFLRFPLSVMALPLGSLDEFVAAAKMPLCDYH